MPGDATLLENIHQNILLAASRVIHQRVAEAAVETVDGWLLVDAGRGAMPFLNGASPVPGSGSHDPAVAERWFDARAAHVLFRLQTGAHDSLNAKLLDRGYAVTREEPVLCNHKPLVPVYDGPLEIIPVRTADDLAVAIDRAGGVAAANEFAYAMSVATAAMPNATELWGFSGDELVAGSIVLSTPPVAGIYAVFCEPNFRRRGFGTAVTWAAAAEGLSNGAESIFLGATVMALPIYRKMGFEPVCEYKMLERPQTQP